MAVAERYLSATVSSNLLVDEKARDVDALIAAGWVAGGDERKAFAFALHRRMAGDDRGISRLVEVLAGWARTRAFTRSRSRHAAPVKGLELSDLAKAVLGWWMHPACGTCGGLGHPMIEGTPVLNEAIACEPCGGSGKRSLTDGMTDRQAELARWMVSEIEIAAPLAFSEVAVRLRKEMDF